MSEDAIDARNALYAGLALAHAAFAAVGFRMALCPAARYWIVLLGTAGLAVLGVAAAGASYLALVF